MNEIYELIRSRKIGRVEVFRASKFSSTLARINMTYCDSCILIYFMFLVCTIRKAPASPPPLMTDGGTFSPVVFITYVRFFFHSSND